MSKPITLRVGICECTTIYKGKMDGRKFNVENSAYVIKEILVPEADQEKVLGTCHIFVDVHIVEGTPQIIVNQVDFMIIDKENYGLAFESWVGEEATQEIVKNRIPPTPRNLIRLLKIIVSYYQPKERKAWLRRMTLCGKKKSRS